MNDDKINDDEVVTNFISSSYFDLQDGDYTKGCDLDTLHQKSFKSEQGKYFWVVTSYDDGSPKEIEAFVHTRYKLRLKFIKKHNEIEEVKILKYKYTRKGEWRVEETEGIVLNWMSFGEIVGFLKFLSGLDLPSINERKIKFAKDSADLDFDDGEIKKIKTLFSTEKGKKLIEELFRGGYLSTNLDIPDLIKNGLSPSKIAEKKARLEEFKVLIDKPDVKEVSDIQAFLRLNPWIFGPEYKALNYATAGYSGNPDGQLLRIDGLSDILEVKLPAEEILREDKMGRQYISLKLAESLGQLTGYMEYYYSEYSQKKDGTGKEILTDTHNNYYKPKGILLIGRRNKELVNATQKTISADSKNMRRLLSYFHWVEVLTYDDLIERAENGLNNLTS